MAVNLIDSNDITITQTGEDITLNLANVDSTTSTSSTNPIQNQAITNYVNKKNTYSTSEEIVIGTWIDGKPLYRKVVYISSLPNNTMTTYQVFTNPNEIDICYIDGSGSYMMIGSEVDTLNWIYSTTGFMMTCLVGKEIRIKTTDNKSTAYAYVAVCYTKTTD